MTAVLCTSDLRASYGAMQVLHGLDLEVHDGEVVVVLGANGAGKTTTLRAISGLVERSGSVRYRDSETIGLSAPDLLRLGIAHVPQGRGTFAELSVGDNLRVGAYTRRDRQISLDIEAWLEVFPVLRSRFEQQAGSLSGGEQQMLAVARALMSNPRLLLLDEPSLGLAPTVVEDLFVRLRSLNVERGMTTLIVEQNAHLALAIAHRGYVLESGSIAVSGDASALSRDDDIRRAYLGI